VSTPATTKESSFNPVFDSQSAFRALLDAISRPGTIAELPRPAYAATPVGLNPHVLTVVSTLCDNRASLALVPPSCANLGDWHRYFAFNISSAIVTLTAADYVVLAGAYCPAGFSKIATGDPEFPEDGSTAIIQVDELIAPEVGSVQKQGSRVDDHDDSVATTTVTLSGPGVPDLRTLAIFGLDAEYLASREHLCAEYPTGVDIFFVDSLGRVASIPRSSSVDWVAKLGRPSMQGTRG
jgi:alpha-D-ribose 1-methylphosphonate 5-triphosphate synthase subunit PhnH